VTTPSSASIRIATRASRLALWQAEHVAALLRRAAPDTAVELVHVTTTGDQDQSDPLRSFGGVGVFTREVQKAVLDGRADIAVHSLKDLPTEPVEGLCLAAVPEREKSGDALVLPPAESAAATAAADLQSLPPGARVGTGSLRRQAQLRHARPDLQLLEIRGNVETRLKKLDAGEYDAIVLAVAGLTRLGLEARISQLLLSPLMYAAVGQGALGIECRSDALPLRVLLHKIEDPVARTRVTAERALLAELRAGCHAPVGVSTRLLGADLRLEAVVLSSDGSRKLTASGSAPLAQAFALGQQVAADLLQQGASALIGRTAPPSPG
jgi:hydroxymethylbilane synthase